jgi:uncharacterized membrane protein HdeD (DUF308 family)
MKKSLMKKLNWLFVIIGILLTYFGFFLISFITTNYDGTYAFFSISVVILGLAVVIAGLAIRFEGDREKE